MHTITRVGSIYMARTAVVVGDVTLGEDSTVWHHVAIRGDVAPIRIGRRVNIQDNAVLHVDWDVPLEIDDDVVIGHAAVLHCRKIGSGTLIGIGAKVLDHCEIGENCVIASGAVVPPDMVVPDGSVVMGMPGKVVREIRDTEKAYIHRVNEAYLKLAKQYAAGEFKSYAEEHMEIQDIATDD